MAETFMINQLMMKSNSTLKSERLQLEKVMITTGCLLDYVYFKNHYKLIAIDLSKQRELDAVPHAIRQIECYEMLNTNSQVYTVLEKSKETVSEFYKGTAKVLKRTYKWLDTTQ